MSAASAAAVAIEAGRAQQATAGDVVGEVALFPELMGDGRGGPVRRADTAIAASSGAAYVLPVVEEDLPDLIATFPEVTTLRLHSDRHSV